MESLVTKLTMKPRVGTTPRAIQLASGKLHLVERGPHIQTRASADDGNAAGGKLAIDQLAGIALKQGGGIRLVDIDDVDHEKRDRSPINRRLGGPDIHAAIDLHGVSGYDGAPDTKRELVGNGAFSDSGRTQDGDDWAGQSLADAVDHLKSLAMEPARYQVLATSISTSTIRPTRSAGSIPAGTGA